MTSGEGEITHCSLGMGHKNPVGSVFEQLQGRSCCLVGFLKAESGEFQAKHPAFLDIWLPVQVCLLPAGPGQHGEGEVRSQRSHTQWELWVKKHSDNCTPGDLEETLLVETLVLCTGLVVGRVKTARKSGMEMCLFIMDRYLLESRKVVLALMS